MTVRSLVAKVWNFAPVLRDQGVSYEAIKRRDVDEETLRSIARSHNVSPQTIGRLVP